ncbi:DUF421 domain-containing protein [Cellulophaga sp. E16_2]|uniref:DUF421 domain-containing protein n=1 Tax=Cellulophaga algicola (strain DSM 14237 / IC166 / ACAM 630) TaxID=688270 RepID=E6X8H0_CELAD|nr:MULTISPECIES: YetF domain-containing protein [Cellulophaga]ADV50826.1 protein of unknown function DUF421 [Cellulophaga algicola DSM 14237]MBO0593221.1 DUF421 domain-containing protein [Cellulophaga sp. E16_2]
MILPVLIQSTNSPILDKLLNIDQQSIALITLSAVGIYLAIIIYTRLFGKRSFSKMSSFDFAMTVSIGSMVATTILSNTVSLIEGAIGLVIVYGLQLAAAYFRRYKKFRDLIDNQPTLLMDGELILKENMKKVRVTEGDLRSKLREANVVKLSEVKAVIFETTGDMVVLHKNNEDQIDPWLLEDVGR